MATQTLSHVNAAPAQTWNWLKINETTLEVPEVKAYDIREVAYGLDIPAGLGKDAEDWLDAAADNGQDISVLAHTAARPMTIVVDPDASIAARSEIVLEEGSSLHLTIVAKGGVAAEGVTGSILRVKADKDSSLELDIVVVQPDASTHLDGVGLLLGENAKAQVRQYLLGAGTIAAGFAAELAGKGASLTVDTRYSAALGQTFDMNYDIRQTGRNTEAVVSATGVLTGDAKKTWRASIDLVHGCKGSHGRESETVLVAGDDARNKTLPVILCSEDDVAGDHGATIGSLSEDQLFYLQCRGLSEDDAVALFGTAFVDDAAATLCPEAAKAVCEWAGYTLGEQAALNAAEAADIAATGKDL
jgi:Fe-S cluster assembly scaffold protein SufB